MVGKREKEREESQQNIARRGRRRGECFEKRERGERERDIIKGKEEGTRKIWG